MALYAKRRQAASRIAAASKIKKAKKEAAAKKLEQAKKIEEERQKAEAEKRRKEDEERAKKAAEEKAKLEAAAAAASADEKAKLEAELKAKEDAAKAEAEKLKKERAAADAEAGKAVAAAEAEAKAAAAPAGGAGGAAGGAKKRTPKRGSTLLFGGGEGRRRDEAEGAAGEGEGGHRVEATIERDANGLGIEVDAVDGKAVIGAVAARRVRGKRSSPRIIVRVFDLNAPTYDLAISDQVGGRLIELTPLRRPVKTILKDDVDMQLGPKREWGKISIELNSTALAFQKTAPPPYQSTINMRDALEVRVSDSPSGGGSMSIITPMTTYEMRSKEGGTLHRWQRNLNALFPQLGVTDRKEGWLQKRGDSANAMFTKRWCVLDSNYRMTYFKDQKREKEQGSVDLSVSYAASETSGNGFEIATPGRTWVFKAEDKDVQASWMAALSAMLNDLREVKKEQQARTGTSMLKAGFAAYRDDAELEEGGTNSEWVKRQWWELTGNGILIVYEKEGG